MRTIVLILCAVFFFSLSVFCQQNEPIIDVHLHAYNLWQNQSDTAWYPPQFKRPVNSEKLMQESFDMMNKYHIVKAIVSGDIKMIQKWQANDPGRLLPGYETWETFTPEHLVGLTQKIKSGEVRVLAEIITQYDGIGASDSSLDGLYALAEQHDIPIGIHMGPGPTGIAFNTKYRSRLSSPLLLEEALVRHPKLRVYVMHAGWPMLDDMVAMLYAYPNLYVDIAVIDWYIPKAEFYFYLRRLVEAGFSSRIMFGSDQMQWPQSISTAIETVQSASFLSKQQKRDIFYNNAVRFFRLGRQQ